jgi:hypothetical protein
VFAPGLGHEQVRKVLVKRVVLVLMLGAAATSCGLPTAPQATTTANLQPQNVTAADVDAWYQTALARPAVAKEHVLFDGMEKTAFLKRVEAEGGCHPKPLISVTPWDVDQCVYWYTNPHIHASPGTLEEYKDQEWTTFMDCLMIEIEGGTLAEY